VTRHRNYRLIPVLAALAVATGCTNPAQSEDAARGTYLLETVNGAEPPVTVEQGAAGTTEITDGAVRLEGSGDCSFERTLRVTSGGSTTTSVDAHACTWLRNGSALFLTLADGGALPTTYDETRGSIALTYQGIDMVFVR
jgi:hypothetical protein